MNGLVLRGRVFLLSGRRLLRTLHMLAVRGLVSSACVGAPLALPSFATAQFKSFFDCGRALAMFASYCVWSVSAPFLFFMGYQGADTDAEQLALTDQLFDAALGELHVVASGQPCLLVGDFNVAPTKIPCLAKRDFGWALG